MAAPLEIQKNTREVIRIAREDFRGNDIINLRVFYDAGGGEYRPTKKGVAFSAALLPEILKALGSLEASGHG